MILHPGIIALLSGSSIVVMMMLYASVVGGIIILKWDFTSSSACQLSLERKTYLISTIMNYVLGFQILSTFLFIYTVDDIHQLFVGAMCVTGSLNANPVGWYALVSKIAVFSFSGLWIVLNYLDQSVEDYPFVKLKYSLLIILLPFIGLDLFLQTYYFLGLDPDIITSCCGSLFSESGNRVTSSMSALPVKLTMVIFYTGMIIFFVISVSCLYSKKGLLRYLQSASAAAVFFTALTEVISFISLYIYELPTHHCPFDILQRRYSFIGYPLYISLFCGTFFGFLPGVFQPFKKGPSLKKKIKGIERKWLGSAIGFMLIFISIATYQVIFSNLILNASL
jgi:hypothetical protein